MRISKKQGRIITKVSRGVRGERKRQAALKKKAMSGLRAARKTLIELKAKCRGGSRAFGNRLDAAYLIVGKYSQKFPEAASPVRASSGEGADLAGDLNDAIDGYIGMLDSALEDFTE